MIITTLYNITLLYYTRYSLRKFAVGRLRVEFWVRARTGCYTIYHIIILGGTDEIIYLQTWTSVYYFHNMYSMSYVIRIRFEHNGHVRYIIYAYRVLFLFHRSIVNNIIIVSIVYRREKNEWKTRVERMYYNTWYELLSELPVRLNKIVKI